jgi:hypothetical protein
MVNLFLIVALVAAFFYYAVYSKVAPGAVLVVDAVFCLALCSVALKYFREVWAYISAILLVVGVVGGRLIGAKTALPMDQVVVSFTLFVFVGAVSLRVLGAYLFPFKKLGIPLIWWAVVLILADSAVSGVLSGGAAAMTVAAVQGGGVLVGLFLGEVGQRIFPVLCPPGSALAGCFLVSEPAAVSRSKPVEKAKPAEKVKTAPAPSRSSVAAGSSKQPIPVVGAKDAPQVKTGGSSVLDSKLAALCGAGPGKKAESSASGGETPAEVVPKSNETGKIVSSVDFS